MHQIFTCSYFFRQFSWIPLPPWKRCHCPTLARNLASHAGRQTQTTPLEQRMEPRRGVSRRSRNKPSLLMGCCHLVLLLLSMAEVFSQAGKTPTKACKKRGTSGSPRQHCPQRQGGVTTDTPKKSPPPPTELNNICNICNKCTRNAT